MGLVLTVPPALEPLTVEEAKRHARVFHDADDLEVAAYIKAGRLWLERYTRRAFVQQTLRATFRDFNRVDDPAIVPLRRPPLVSVTSVEYRHASTGVLTLLAATEYEVDPSGLVGHVEPSTSPTSKSWPGVKVGPQAVRITYVAGYGAAGSDVPEDLREALRLLVTHQYEQRAPVLVGTIAAELPMGVRSLAYHHRVLTFPRNTPPE